MFDDGVLEHTKLIETFPKLHLLTSLRVRYSMEGFSSFGLIRKKLLQWTTKEALSSMQTVRTYDTCCFKRHKLNTMHNVRDHTHANL